MQNSDFDKWWLEINYRHRNDKDGGYDYANDLENEMSSFSQDIRENFISQLLQIGESAKASFLIQKFGNFEQNLEVRNLLRKYIEEKKTDSKIKQYIETIIKTYSLEDHDLIKNYFLNHQNDKWFLIPNELYDIDKELFLEAYKKYFPNINDAFLFESFSFLWLASRLDIMEYLIHNFSPEQSKRLKKMAFVKSQYEVLSKEKRMKLLLLSKM